MTNDVTEMHLLLENGSTLELKGRVAWTAHALLSAGEKGITPIERPAPRWSDYVFRLRGEGLNIETIDEKHGGALQGHPCPVCLAHTSRSGEDRLCGR